PAPPTAGAAVVPKRVFPDRIKLLLDSPSVKLYKTLNPVPSVLTANSVPLPELPPAAANPYRVLSDKINPLGNHPSLAAKLCRTVKPVASVCRANTVPTPELPPTPAVPYNVLLDKTNPAGLAPSVLSPFASDAVKEWSTVKPVPSVLSLKTVPLPPLPPNAVVPYRALLHKINLPTGKAPSLLVRFGWGAAVKLCSVVKPVPSVLRANTVPLSELPPSSAVP